jgi:hypothetical protein
MELVMRRFLLAGTTFAALVVLPIGASAQYYWGGDPYGASPLFGYPPPPAYGYVEAPVAAVPAPQVYVAPGTAYRDEPIIINGQRYYRDCWWDWGQRKCELKPWW